MKSEGRRSTWQWFEGRKRRWFVEIFESWSNIQHFAFIVSEAGRDRRKELVWNKPRVDAL